MIIIALLVTVLAGVGVYFLTRPKNEDVFVEKEISIKQAEIPQIKTLTYEDTSGFSFTYPSNLTIKEIELDNNSVYSSLEIAGANPGKLTLRISDTNYPDLSAWQRDFEKTNVLSDVQPVNWADLSAVAFTYGAPKTKRAMTLKDNVLYVLEGPADAGYWEKNLDTILSSFRFSDAVFTSAPAVNATATSPDEDIVLVEETLQ